MDNKKVILIWDCNSDFVAVWDHYPFEAKDFGHWVMAELFMLGEMCKNPCAHIKPTNVTQQQLDELLVEELLYHADGRIRG